MSNPFYNPSSLPQDAKNTDGCTPRCIECKRTSSPKWYKKKTLCRTCYANNRYKRVVIASPRYFADRAKAYRKKAPDKVKDSFLKSKYGISLATYLEMLEKQEGKCAICRSVDPGRKGVDTFCIDHNHLTGEVRGLLCAKCNSGLGHFLDKPHNLEAALEYLKKYGNY